MTDQPTYTVTLSPPLWRAVALVLDTAPIPDPPLWWEDTIAAAAEVDVHGERAIPWDLWFRLHRTHVHQVDVEEQVAATAVWRIRDATAGTHRAPRFDPPLCPTCGVPPSYSHNGMAHERAGKGW